MKQGRIHLTQFPTLILLIFSSLLFVGCKQDPETVIANAKSAIPTSATKPSTSPTPGTPGSTPAPRPSATPVATATPVPSSTPSSKPPVLAGALGIKESVDMRKFDGPVVSQFGGTCSAFATAAAMNNIIHKKGGTANVSERHLWSTYETYDAWYAMDAAKKNYITESQAWPINATRAPAGYQNYATHRVLQYKEHDYNMESALQGLSQEHPLTLAIQVPQGLANCETMISPNSKYTSGQHVVEAVGYKLDDSVSGGGYFILKNSWGTDCGERGYHYYPFSLCKRSDLYCYFIEVVDAE